MTKVATKGAFHAAPHRKSLASRIWEYRQIRYTFESHEIDIMEDDGE